VKKPSLSDALARKAPAAPVSDPTPAEVAPAPAAKKKRDDRVTTTVRLPVTWLEGLKILAAKERTKVNDLLLEGAAHVMALRGHKPE
jgi:hypothetical protein